ncbi:hypothetical protein C823_007494 [Eubacterium plexicaudatum ASF492]|nr:hypothetical protein C823_007494 [Eubacterium plexicaudatum ASF492]
MNDDIVKRIRNFNRYYTAWLEVMNKEYLKTGFSWTESRVIFEIHICPGINATELCEHLNTDKSYISRILMKFEKDGLLTRELILGSKGLKKIWLTEAGEKIAHQINMNGNQQIVDKLKMLDDDICVKLCEAMEFIEKVLRENDKGGTRE